MQILFEGLKFVPSVVEYPHIVVITDRRLVIHQVQASQGNKVAACDVGGQDMFYLFIKISMYFLIGGLAVFYALPPSVIVAEKR